MRGGKTPIHIQRWSPSDYQHDEHVQVLLAQRAWMILTFYRQFLDASFLAGGDLPSDPRALSACVRMPLPDVRKALAFCVGKLIFEENGRLYQKRVRADVARELEFRERQAIEGAKGGRRLAQGKPKASLSGQASPPAPAPAPAPAPEDLPCQLTPDGQVVPPPYEPPPSRPSWETEALRLCRRIGALRFPAIPEEHRGVEHAGIMREFTAFKGLGGVVNPAKLANFERLQHAVLAMRAEVERLEAEALPPKPEPTGPQFFGVRR